MADQEREELWVTTEDNPIDPFDNYDEWNAFDRQNGYDVIGRAYNTEERIAALANTSSGMSENMYNEELNNACRRLVELNPTGNYRLVRRRVTSTTKKE